MYSDRPDTGFAFKKRTFVIFAQIFELNNPYLSIFE